MSGLQVASQVEAAMVRVHDGGHLEVLKAPRVAEFSMDVLGQVGPLAAVAVDLAGHLDLAGQATYRPVGFRQDLTGRLTLICERVCH